MAMLPSVFNAKDSEKMTDFTPLQPGWYEAEIVKSSIVDTKAGTGKYIKLQFKTTYNGKPRFVFTNLNIINPNPIAEEIAKKELATICEACGVDEIEDTADLHNIQIGIRITIKPATAQWPAGNEIKSYCALDDMPDDATADDFNPF